MFNCDAGHSTHVQYDGYGRSITTWDVLSKENLYHYAFADDDDNIEFSEKYELLCFGDCPVCDGWID